MTNRKLQVLSLGLTLVAGTLFGGVKSAFACHEATGWCCVDQACCYFEDNKLLECFRIH
jgi:uncharacterized protein (DUF697 family)